MTQEAKTSTVVRQAEILFFVLLFVLLQMSSIAVGKSQHSGKRLSCKTLRSMARIYMAYGEYEKARPYAEEALSSAKMGNVSDQELAMCLIDLSSLYKSQGRLSEAEKMCEDGLSLQEQVLFKEHPYLAYTLRTLSSVYRESGKLDKARASLDRAMAIMLDSHSEDDKALAPFFVDIAKLLVTEGNLSEAEGYYSRAIRTISNSYGPDHLYTAEVLGDIARLYVLQGKHLEAEPLIAQTLSIQEKIYGSDHPLMAPTLLTIAEICQAKGDQEGWENLIQRAKIAVEKTEDATAATKLYQRIAEIRNLKQNVSSPLVGVVK